MQPTDGAKPKPQFTGLAPLFPLPHVALFPNVMLPLHVFEPRYRTMVQDVLGTDGYIALGTLKDGWELSYETKSCPVHSTLCLGQIVADERLEDGRYFLLVQGLCRAHLVSEVTTKLPYRVAEVRLIPDVYPTVPVINREHRTHELVHYFQQSCPEIGQSLLQAIDDGVPLGELCDVIAHAMKPELHHAQRLLEQVDVDQRSDLVLELLKLQCRESTTSFRMFPPGFSLN